MAMCKGVLSLYVRNIPNQSLSKDEEFTYRESDKDVRKFFEHIIQYVEILRENEPRYLDVQIFEIEIVCDIPPPPKPERRKCKCHLPMVTCLPPHLNFGKITLGFTGQKTFAIKNVFDEEILWNAVEFKCNIDKTPTMCVVNSQNLSCYGGKLSVGEEKRITYGLHAKCLGQWCSIVSIFAKNQHLTTCRLETIVFVTFEVINNQLKIYTETNSDSPLLAPLKALYLRTPSTYSVFIKNDGYVNGSFYFLNPPCPHQGVSVKFRPKCGVILPGNTFEVKVTLTPQESRFYKFFIPCFMGDLEDISCLKVVFVTEGMSVNFGLPGYPTITWPPVKECQTCEDACADKIQINPEDETTYPMLKITLKPNESKEIILKIKNNTPISSKYLIEAQKLFIADHKINQDICLKAKYFNSAHFFDLCSNGNGLVVFADPESGTFSSEEKLEIKINIYATTWGCYEDRIVVDIDDLLPFPINLNIEVTGGPLQFQFAVETKLDQPILRLGSISHVEEVVERSVMIKNISCVPIYVTWHVFNWRPYWDQSSRPFSLIFDFLNDKEAELSITEFMGRESSNYFKISPREMILDKLEYGKLKITIYPRKLIKSYKEITLLGKILGTIRVEEEYRIKPDVYVRKVHPELPPLTLDITGEIEVPFLRLHLMGVVNVRSVYANNLIFKNEKITFSLRFKNVDKAEIKAKFEINQPFVITNQQDVFVLKRGEMLDLCLDFISSHENLTCWAKWVYDHREEFQYVACVKQYLRVSQQRFHQAFPIEVVIHFPRIEVTPRFLNFEQVLVHNTKKMFIEIRNTTGASVKIECSKSFKETFFVVIPSHVEIPGCNENNIQIAHIGVLFTPIKCTKYNEILRIHTNFSSYYVDVSVIGYGTNNERFHFVN